MSTYPETDPELTFEAAFGADLTADPDTWTFTDLSALIVGNPITITPGVAVGVGTVKTGSLSGLTLLNDDGDLTPFLPTSPYYPYVDVGTPARLAIRTDTSTWIADQFARTVASGWGTSTSGAVWSGTTALSVAGGKGVVSIGSVGATTHPRTVYTHRDIDVRWDMSIAAVSTGASTMLGPTLRGNAADTDMIWPGLEFGTGGTVLWTVRTYQASVGTIRQQVTEAGLTYSAGTVLSAHVALVGSRLRARAWLAAGVEPDGWTIDVDLSVLGAADDYLGMFAWVVPGNTNTLPNPISVDNISVQQPRYARYEGYITDVQPAFRPIGDGTTASVVTIKLGGIGTRLEKKDAPAWTPLRRSLQLASTPPVELWMLEDKSGALTAASAFDGHTPMTVVGPAVFEFDTGVPADLVISKYGTSGLCSLAAGAKLSGTVPASGTWTAWTASLLVDQFTSLVGGGITEVRQLEWTTPGAALNRWALVRTMTGHTVRAYNDTTLTSTDVCSFAHAFAGLFMVEASAVQSGGNINVTLYINANVEATGSIAGTVSAAYRVQVNPDQINTTASTSPVGIRFVVGAVMVHDQAGTWLPYYGDSVLNTTPRADRGWGYEAAHRRAGRLCDEENVPFRQIGDPYSTGVTELNVQQPGAFQALVTQAVDSESGGLLFESDFGFAERDRTDRYNAPVDLTIDMSAYCYSDGTEPDAVLLPKLDPRGPNYWTVQRTNGSSATYAAPKAFRDRRGTIAQQATLDVLYDADCPVHASWRTHLNVDGQGANYAQASLDLAANPDLIDDWLRCTIGSRIQRTNQPTIAGLGVIDQIIDGYTETITPRAAGGPAWIAVLDTSPAQVWQVGVYDTGFRYDSSSTTLATAMSSTDTVMGFTTVKQGDLWTLTNAPFTVTCLGQTNTVLWMSNAGSISPLEGGFETGISGWSTQAGCSLAASNTFAHAGTASGRLTVGGSPTNATVFPATAWGVGAGLSYTAVGWLYATGSVPNARITISWYNGSLTFLSSSGSTPITLSAGVWTQVTVTAVAPAGAAFARPAPGLTSSPTNGTVVYVDDVDMVRDSAGASGAGPYVQSAWTTRDPDITKALPAGEPIHVAQQGRWAL